MADLVGCPPVAVFVCELVGGDCFLGALENHLRVYVCAVELEILVRVLNLGRIREVT